MRSYASAPTCGVHPVPPYVPQPQPSLPPASPPPPHALTPHTAMTQKEQWLNLRMYIVTFRGGAEKLAGQRLGLAKDLDHMSNTASG